MSNGIVIGSTEASIKLTDKLIMKIVMSPVADSVKLAALELLKHKFSSPTYNSLSNINIDMTHEQQQEESDEL